MTVADEDLLLEEFRELERQVALRDCVHDSLIGRSMNGPFRCAFCGRPESELPPLSKRGIRLDGGP